MLPAWLRASWLERALSTFVCGSVYERAYRNLREDQPDAKEEAVMLLEAWRSLEQRAAAAAGTPGTNRASPAQLNRGLPWSWLSAVINVSVKVDAVMLLQA